MSNFKQEESAMAIVFYQQQILTTNEMIYGKQVLSLPKGHVEKGETYIETAIRECFEETNLILHKDEVIDTLSPIHIEFINHHNEEIHKTIYPIVFSIKHQSLLKAKEERIISVQFMDYALFLEKCSYENVKNLLKNYQRKEEENEKSSSLKNN